MEGELSPLQHLMVCLCLFLWLETGFLCSPGCPATRCVVEQAGFELHASASLRSAGFEGVQRLKGFVLRVYECVWSKALC